MWTTFYRHTEEFKENLRQTLLLSKLNLSVILGKTEIYLNDFLNLEVGDVIRLDSFYDEPIDLEIEERPIFKVNVGKSKGFYSVKIVDKNRELLERLLVEESMKKRQKSKILLKKVKIQKKQEMNKMPENEDQFLNQNELDSLLKGINNSDDPEQKEGEEASTVNEKLDALLDMMGEIANITMGSGATTLSTLLRRKIEIQYPQTDIIKFKNISTNFEGENVIVTVEYKRGLYGLNTLVLPLNLTNIIADLMLGKDLENIEEREFDDISLSAVSEAMNQMMGTASTALSDFLKTNIDISPPNTKVMNFSDPNIEFPPIETDKEAYVISIKFNMKINGIAETTFWQFIPMKFAQKIRELMEKTFGKITVSEESSKSSNVKEKAILT